MVEGEGEIQCAMIQCTVHDTVQYSTVQYSTLHAPKSQKLKIKIKQAKSTEPVTADSGLCMKVHDVYGSTVYACRGQLPV